MNKKKTVNFGSSIKAEGGIMQKPQFQAPPLTTEEKVDAIAKKSAELFNEHGDALNAMAMWIEAQDKEVQLEGNVLNWAIKKMKEKERLDERKEEYEKNKK